MIKHIVIWRLKDFAEGNQKEVNAAIVKRKLESLSGRIPGMSLIEAGIDFSRSDSSGDIVLYCEFSGRDALDTYQKHPEHVAIKDFIGNVTQERRVVDYEQS
ncbi:MAG: Dabb family protein [Chlorobiaceae bacterium]|nr:Dabb family protein [Chlorobiaceae bacterium]NTV60377.1 Dabb family protein [Chlorobiaceae bacterium]